MNKNDPELVHQMYYRKTLDSNNFIKYLKEEEKNVIKIDKEKTKENMKKHSIGNKFTYNIKFKIKLKLLTKRKKMRRR